MSEAVARRATARKGASRVLSQRRRDSRLFEALLRLWQNKAAVTGVGIIALLVLVAAFAPFLAPFDPIEVSPGEALTGPSLQHLMGTDYIGRDIFSQVVFGSRMTLHVGFVSVAIGALSGTILGLCAGYYTRWADGLIMRVMDMMLAFPGILLAMVIVAVMGTGLTKVMIAVGISTIPIYTRLARGSVLTVKEMPYVEAARTVGCGDMRVIFLHLLPNILSPLIVVSTLGMGRAIISAAALSFLGLGAQPPTPEWGAMVSAGRNYLRGAWWISSFPGLAIMIAVMAINMVGDGLREALDPRLRRR
jgi:peptide/nickel transport system permease protein